ncbi:MAG: hypothetical protein LC799_22845, partial [Actinobacteria bacterium]|nr:hypothetical protein [Actinomycetota bacterium]
AGHLRPSLRGVNCGGMLCVDSETRREYTWAGHERVKTSSPLPGSLETSGQRIVGPHNFLDTALFTPFGLPARFDG